MESPARICIGAIINGKQYGNIVSIDDYIKQTPSGYVLRNNYPNPFNPSTKIKFTVLSASKTQNHNPAQNTTLKIYDVLGREVAKLIDEALSPGDYEENFNPGTLASGVYFAILNTGGKVYKQKMMYLK